MLLFFHLHEFLLSWCTGDVSQSPTRCSLAALATRVLIALNLHNTKAGSLQLSSAHFLRSTFDLISPAIPTALASKPLKIIRDDAGPTFVKLSVVSVHDFYEFPIRKNIVSVHDFFEFPIRKNSRQPRHRHMPQDPRGPSSPHE